MPQKFINNFDVLTSFAIDAEVDFVLGDLLAGEALDRINALISTYGDWVELALIGESGQMENLRVGSDLERDYTGNGSGALAWPAGSRLIAPYTAAAASAAKALTRPIISVAGDVLTISPIGAWEWAPYLIDPLVIDNSQVSAEFAGDFIMPAAVVMMDTYGSDDPVSISVVSAPAFAKLSAGVTGIYDAELGSYQITLPATKRYLLRFSGINSARTLDISDYSEYTAVA
jgi:hypothetical protein